MMCWKETSSSASPAAASSTTTKPELVTPETTASAHHTLNECDGDNLSWASLIKEQHRHLQDAVVSATSSLPQQKVNDNNRATVSTEGASLPPVPSSLLYEADLRAWKAAIGGAEAARRLSAYSTAMHHLATQYWDPTPDDSSAGTPSTNATEASQTALSSTAPEKNCCSDLRDPSWSVKCDKSTDPLAGEKRSREEVESSKMEGGAGKHNAPNNDVDSEVGGTVTKAPRHYNDRLQYCLQSTACYFLGEISTKPQSDGLKADADSSNHCKTEDDSLPSICSGKSHKRQRDKHQQAVQPLVVPVHDTIYLHLPAVMARVVKPLRRAFFDMYGRMATGEEVGELVHACTPNDEGTPTANTGASSLSVPTGPATTPDSSNMGGASCVGLLMDTHPTGQSVKEDSNWRRGVGTGWAAALRYTQAGIPSVVSDKDGQYVCSNSPLPPSLRVLDVGSCYGPFFGKRLSRIQPLLPVPLDVTSIDLAPYVEKKVAQAAMPQQRKDAPLPRVWQGDWLQMQFISAVEKSAMKREATASLRSAEDGRVWYKVSSATEGALLSVVALQLESYDAVYFCLLLSYMPTPRLRFLACLHACFALKEGGLLVIVSTRTQGSRRGNWMQEWTSCLSTIGLQRVQQSTQEKIVGMAFAKVCPSKEVHDSWQTAEGRAAWIRAMMTTKAANQGLSIIADDANSRADI